MTNQMVATIVLQKRWHHKNFLAFQCFGSTMYRWSMMRNIHIPNSYEPSQFTLISMGLNYVFMQPYLRPTWTNSCQIWCVRVFHHVLLKYGHENAEMQKRQFDDVTLHYSRLKHYMGVKRVLIPPLPSLVLTVTSHLRLTEFRRFNKHV